MSIEDRIVTTDRAGFRARIVHDDDPHEPEFEAGCPTYRLEYRYEWSLDHVYGEEDDRRARALTKWLNEYGRIDGLAVFQRYLRIFCEGNAALISSQYDRSGPDYVTWITRELVREWGNTDDKPVPEAEAGEWQSYIDGECYGIIVEQRVTTYTVTLDADDNVVDHGQDDDWREVDACWGFYGDPDDESGKYIRDEARSYIDDASPLATPPAGT